MSGKKVELKTEVQKKVDALCRLKEDDLTKKIMLPLFQSMGYDRVEFNGGPLERGRDLIAQKDNPPLPNPKTIYVQAKKIKYSKKAAGGVLFDKLCQQVRQCLHETVTDIHGREYKADEVFIVCPNQVSSRFIDEIKSYFFAPDNQKIHLLDGVAVLRLIEQYKPSLMELLLNIEEKIIGETGFSPGNRELLQAIKQGGNKNIEKLYNDLSFFVGSVDSNLLLHFDVKLLKRAHEVEEESWEDFKRALSQFEVRYGVSICSTPLSRVEDSFLERLKDFESDENQQLISERDRLNEVIADASRAVDELSSTLLSRIEKLKSTKEISDEQEEVIKRQVKECSEGGLAQGKVNQHFSRDISSLISFSRRIKKADNRLKEIRPEILKRPKYSVECDFEGVRSSVGDRVNDYFCSIKKINGRKVSKIELEKFLIKTEDTLSFVSDLFSSHQLRNFFEFVFSKDKEDRVSISAHDIFETGHDIAVYGSAGVGKTTTLEMYSKHCEAAGKNVVYVPLNRTVDRLSKIKAANYDESNHGQAIFVKDLLIKAILVSRRIDPDNDKIDSAKRFFAKGPTLVLDGLDEAFSAVSEIIVGIRNYKLEYPKSQIIISSRDCVSYLNEIDFFGITLLPFTKIQLLDFINKWFEEDQKKARSLIDRISNDEALDALKTPLLATIACSLVEKGVQAPSSESEIYSERLRLLMGDYDVHKGISRQSNTSSRLFQCASLLALAMHEKRVRSVSMQLMKRYLFDKLRGRFDGKLIDSCLSELVDPCCILFLDPISKEYSFGHFRFQEHLVAKAIRADRGISIAEITAQDWWRGALCIYAQEGNFSSIVEDVYDLNGNIKKSLITLREMAANAPISERENVKAIIDMYAEQDDFESLVLDDYSTEYTSADFDDLGI